MSNESKKRRTVFIQRGFQAKFVIWVVGLLLLCCLCSSAVLYPLLSSEVTSQLSAGHRDVAQTGDRVVLAIVTGNLLAIVVAALATCVVVLYISHKVAGPLYRFERLCDEIGRGNLDVSAVLRETDQLKGLSRAFSVMLTHLRDRRQDQCARLDNARATLDGLRANLSDVAKTREGLETLHALLASLKDEIGGTAGK